MRNISLPKESIRMGKHHDKIAAALEIRIATVPQDRSKSGRAYKKPGSQNKRKTGYMGVRAKRRG
jgi:hypothetical protein